MDDRFRNQERLLDGEAIKTTKIILIGAGAIGSYFAATLAKMGARDITVYDDDKIEDHNISNQLYPVYLIGKPKVEALETVAFDYGEAKVKAINERWNHDNAQDGDIIVVAVDDMDVRKAIWDYYKSRPHKLFLEGRMAAQVFSVFGVEAQNKAAQDYYETQLYPQAEAMPDRCGEKSIIYTVLQVSGQMCSQVKRFLMNEYRPTRVNYDCLNDDVIKGPYHMELKMEEFEAPDEPEEVVGLAGQEHILDAVNYGMVSTKE